MESVNILGGRSQSGISLVKIVFKAVWFRCRIVLGLLIRIVNEIRIGYRSVITIAFRLRIALDSTGCTGFRCVVFEESEGTGIEGSKQMCTRTWVE